MTTHKQRRANIAEKRARFDASYRADGQAALARSKDRDAQRMFDHEREENKKKAAKHIAEVHAAERASKEMHENDLFKDESEYA